MEGVIYLVPYFSSLSEVSKIGCIALAATFSAALQAFVGGGSTNRLPRSCELFVLFSVAPNC